MIALTLGLAFMGGSAAALAADDSYVLATGRASGKSYAVGVGLSSIAKIKLLPSHQIDLSEVETKGFVQNVRMLQNGEAQFAVLQAMFGHFARTGTGTFAGESPSDDIQAIAMLWRDADHFVMQKDYITTGKIADLASVQGMPVSMGVDGPGPIESNRLLLHHLGVDVDRGFELMHMDYQESAKALQRGEIVALSTPIRPPAEHMKGILADGRHRLLAFTDADIARADGGLGLWTRYVIPAATYSGQDQDIQTVAKSNLLVARADVDEEVVYRVTKAMFENLSLLRGIHEAVDETALDQALIGMPMLLHPGALRYYKEVGLVAADSDLDVALADQLRIKPAFMASGAIDTEQAQAETLAGDNETSVTIAKAEAPADVQAETFVVYFGLGSKLIDAAGVRVISEAKALIDQLVAARIEIGGHTDQLGNPSHNAQLAKARAEAVMNALSDIDSHEVAVKTYGERTPAVSLGREIEALNRRVEIKIQPAGQTAKVAAPTETRSSDNAAAHKTPSWLLRVTM